MKIKTADLIGPALDWAVAKAQGRTEIKIFSRTRSNDRGWIEVRFNPEPKAATARFAPSENWDQGGPIIEREGIKVGIIDDDVPIIWAAQLSDPWGKRTSVHSCTGPTPLIAAMRCFVASRLGDEIDIPEGLL